MRPLLAAAALALSTACASPYRPGSLRGLSPAAADRTLGCVEVSARVYSGAEAEAAIMPSGRGAGACLDYERRAHQLPPASTVVALRFGNRCDRAVSLDLTALSVRAVYGGGAERLLSRYDPALEVGPGVLDPGAHGEELLEFDLGEAGEAADEVCLDLRGIARGAGEGAQGIVCFERDAGGLVPVESRAAAPAGAGAADDGDNAEKRGGRP